MTVFLEFSCKSDRVEKSVCGFCFVLLFCDCLFHLSLRHIPVARFLLL